jgi:hypothetical protein
LKIYNLKKIKNTLLFSLLKMCFNKEVSWGAFVFGEITAIALLLYATQKNWLELQIIALWFMFIVTVQFFEALAWMGYDKLGAYGVLTFIPFQPILLALLFILVPTISIEIKVIAIVLISIYIMTLLLNFNSIPKFDSLSTTSECNHLVQSYWGNMQFGSIFYLFLMFIIPILFLSPKLAISVVLLEILTFATSFYFYPCSVAGLWCFFAVSAPILLLIFANAGFIENNNSEK